MKVIGNPIRKDKFNTTRFFLSIGKKDITYVKRVFMVIIWVIIKITIYFQYFESHEFFAF